MKKRLSFAIQICFMLGIMLLSGCGRTCSVEDCENEPLENSEYCEEHTCFVYGCFNAKVEGSEYCQEHTCGVDGCFSLVENGSEGCKEHVCVICNCIIDPNTCEKNCKNEYICSSCMKKGCALCHHPIVKGTARYVGATEFCSEECLNDALGTIIQSEYCEICGAEVYWGVNAYQQWDGYDCLCWECYLASLPTSTPVKSTESENCNDKKTVDSNGKQIWQVYAKSSELHFTGSFRGDGYFGIKILDSNQDFFALVANEIGDYNVDKSVYGLIPNEMYYIQIECTEGSWTCSWTGTYGR